MWRIFCQLSKTETRLLNVHSLTQGRVNVINEETQAPNGVVKTRKRVDRHACLPYVYQTFSGATQLLLADLLVRNGYHVVEQ